MLRFVLLSGVFEALRRRILEDERRCDERGMALVAFRIHGPGEGAVERLVELRNDGGIGMIHGFRANLQLLWQYRSLRDEGAIGAWIDQYIDHAVGGLR